MGGKKEEKEEIKRGNENYTDYLSATIRKRGYQGKELSGDNDENLRTRGGNFFFSSYRRPICLVKLPGKRARDETRIHCSPSWG